MRKEQLMASYGYEAINRMGKTIKGSLEAETPEAVKAQLKAQDLTLLSVSEQGFLTKELEINIGGAPKPRDLAVFCRQFVSMTRAGVTILDSMKMLSDQTENKQLKKAVEGVRVNVEKGETLANSLANYPKIFPELMVNMVSAGEASGSLEIAMERMAVQFEKSAKTKALVKKALIYPIVVMVVAVVMVVVMLVVVIPKYTKMFEEMGTELPGITRAVQTASNFLMQYWFIILPIIAGAVAALVAFGRTDNGKHVFHKLKLKLPAIGDLETKQASSMMARTLSTLMAAGVPLVEATQIVSTTMENVYFKEALLSCREEVMIGQPLSRPLEECGLFPPMVYHMTRIGEESGNTEEMLVKLADYYDEEVEMAVSSFMAAMEPMIVIVLAVVVGFLIAACMAPMLSMYTAIDSL